MSESTQFKFSNTVLLVPLAAMLSIWFVYWVEIAFGYNFNEFGVLPRTVTGVRGIVFSPFIHGSLSHLYNNTIPLGVLLLALFYFYRSVAWKVLLFGILLSGFLTWCTGRNSFHIGASGLIYVFASFIFFKGIISKYYRLVALSLVVVFIYGSLLWYIFPVKVGISWEGHLAGFLTGLLFTFVFKTHVLKPKQYAWEKDDFNAEEDPFLQHFDEDGNFIESSLNENSSNDNDTEINYVYHLKKENKD